MWLLLRDPMNQFLQVYVPLILFIREIIQIRADIEAAYMLDELHWFFWGPSLMAFNNISLSTLFYTIYNHWSSNIRRSWAPIHTATRLPILYSINLCLKWDRLLWQYQPWALPIWFTYSLLASRTIFNRLNYCFVQCFIHLRQSLLRLWKIIVTICHFVFSNVDI